MSEYTCKNRIALFDCRNDCTQKHYFSQVRNYNICKYLLVFCKNEVRIIAYYEDIRGSIEVD